MKIIISPAKKMNVNRDDFSTQSMPIFLAKTSEILAQLKQNSLEELRTIWKCNDKIVEQNFERIQNMNLETADTPAIMAYDGIQYTYMAPSVLDSKSLEYLNEYLFILSGFYGLLRPFDAITPYRLEMQAKLNGKINSLYDFWGNLIAREIFKDSDIVLNLASLEYSKVISKFKTDNKRIIDLVFGELKDEKISIKSTQAKRTRGEMVRFLAENKITDLEQIKKFNISNFSYNEELSNKDSMVFIKKGE